jgi:2-polyprenyl-6-methoxyphenol hydroxylase-like FAD-dependent oxidoreductase
MDRTDVIILGGGLVGLALASALDSSGLSAIIVDPADPDLRLDASFDGRTSAVSSSSMRMLTATGVADHFPVAGCPILKIQVADGLYPGGLAFEPDEDEGLSAGCMRTGTFGRRFAPARRLGKISGCCGSHESPMWIAASTRWW